MKLKHHLICSLDWALGNTVVKPIEEPQLQKLGQEGLESNCQTGSFIIVDIVIRIQKFIAQLQIHAARHKYVQRRKHRQLPDGLAT